MSQTIWKYQVYADGENNIALPAGAKILSVQNQSEEIVLYSLVNSEAKGKDLLKVKVFGTGQEILDIDDYEFLDTVSLYSGSLVFHVFYKVVKDKLFTVVEKETSN